MEGGNLKIIRVTQKGSPDSSPEGARRRNAQKGCDPLTWDMAGALGHDVLVFV